VFSNLFVVTNVLDPNAPTIHVVQPGETLNEIAVYYQRSVEAIQNANPQISNVNQLNFRERLIIPGLTETIVLTPPSGPPGRTIEVTGFGFPPQTRIDIGIGLQASDIQIQNTVITGTEGGFRSAAVLAESALAGQRWTVFAVQYNPGMPGFIVASEEFIVTQPRPTLEPQVSIWPLNGPPGTRLHIVGSSLPQFSQIQFTLGPQDTAPYLTGTTWTEINGTFASEVIIPTSANFGENWQVIVSGIDDPAIQANSALFTVQQSIHP
jgi:LysM repeat protein